MGLKTPIPESLIRELGERFPDRCPRFGMSTEEVWFAAGQAAVVRFLRDAMEEQDEFQGVA